jgi:hypothetical protein
MLDKGEPGADIIAGRTSCGTGRSLLNIDRTFMTMITKGNNFLDSLLFTVFREIIV